MVLPGALRRSEGHQGLRRVLEGRRGQAVDPADATFLARAVELAARATGETAPNPPVGAVIALLVKISVAKPEPHALPDEAGAGAAAASAW